MLTGKELKIKRVINEISATRVSEVLGVSKSYVSHMEKGRRSIPDSLYLKWLEKIEMKI